MIRKNTVFILGAGASSDFGFPLGERLRKEVIQTFKNPNNKEVVNVAKVLTGPWPDDHNDYIRPITDFSNKLYLDADYSIDAFLERFKEAYLTIGKLAIAQILAKYENQDQFYENDNWLRIIYKQMKQGASIDTFTNNKVAFVTFNYDRSLEHFLYTSLLSFHEKISENHVRNIINQIPIIHVYGQLDSLPWQNTDGRPYGSSITLGQLKRYKENINIIFEDVTNTINLSLQKAYDLFKQAERIYILGFGFHQININRLRLNDFGGKNIIATSYGLGREEARLITDYLTDVRTYNVNNAIRDITNRTKLYDIPVYDLVNKFLDLD